MSGSIIPSDKSFADIAKSFLDFIQDPKAVKNLEQLHLTAREQSLLTEAEKAKAEEARDLIKKRDILLEEIGAKASKLSEDKSKYEQESQEDKMVRGALHALLEKRAEELVNATAAHKDNVAQHEQSVSAFETEVARFKQQKSAYQEHLQASNESLTQKEEELQEYERRLASREQELNQRDETLLGFLKQRK